MGAGMTGRPAMADSERGQPFRRQPATPATDRPQIVRARQHCRQRNPDNRRQRVAPPLQPPAIRQLFPQPDIFMSMVRNGYPPVYRHKTFEFGESSVQDGSIAQRVHIIDADGVPWEALYTLERQPDGSLKITGCSLLKAGQVV